MREKSELKGKRLRQAIQHTYNTALEETEKSMDSLKAALKNKDVGQDLKSCEVLVLHNLGSNWF